MIRDTDSARAADLMRMAEHQREAGRKCLALAIGSGDDSIQSSFLEMALEYESRATRFEEDARGASVAGGEA